MNAALEKKESHNFEAPFSNNPGRGLRHKLRKSEQLPRRHVRSKLIYGLVALVTLGVSLLIQTKAEAHGFNANHVDIVKTFGRKYRVIIKYTHVELGEYREAHIDFEKKEDAIKAFQDLVKGADFFLGDVKKSIHFHTPPEGNSPY